MDTGKGGKRGVGECCGLGVGGGWEGRVSCVTYFCFTFVLVFGSLFVSLVVPNIQSIFGLIGLFFCLFFFYFLFFIVLSNC